MNGNNNEQGTVNVRIDSVIKHRDKWLVPDRMSTRLVRCASSLNRDSFIGWQMSVPTKGLVGMTIFGSDDVSKDDLKWIIEKTAKVSKSNKAEKVNNELKELYELFLPIVENETSSQMGFNADTSNGTDSCYSMWPSSYASEFNELVSAMRETGAVLKAVVGSADEKEQKNCRERAIKTFDIHNFSLKDYIGVPVKARFLLLLPMKPSLRLKAVIKESSRGIDIRYIGNLDEADINEIWNKPLNGAQIYPDCAARIMLFEPELVDNVLGIKVSEEPVKKLPASHKDTKCKSFVTIGRAIDSSGLKRKIKIGDTDIKRHYQIIGQTGTGKSTLLANTILGAIEKGYGLTFFDPHGTTIDEILKSIPKKYADRIRVVRIGDKENPVPLNIWDSDDFEKEERTISDLCELFGDIFDPNHEGFVGPRYERWLSTFCKASIAVFGRRASLESIAVISQSQDNMYNAAKIFAGKYPELAETIRQEFGLDRSNDFHATLNWYLCKFQRLTAVEQMRKTLGAGTNALDFKHAIDTNVVTLIDLASPSIGAHAARIIGTIILMKLWNAAMQRENRDKTHIVVVDEASLFQTNPMPRMLAEGRKFGISMILSHQHSGQLTEEIKDALEANSANFSAFRLSTKDAEKAATRFDDPKMKTMLARIDAFNAITTISVDGVQTAPFTLEISKPKPQKDASETAALIEKQSIDTLVKPYQRLRALTSAEMLECITNPKKLEAVKNECNEPSYESKSKPEWYRDWERMHGQFKKVI